MCGFCFLLIYFPPICFSIVFLSNQLSCDNHISGMRPRKHSCLQTDKRVRATDLIAYAAMSPAEVDDLGGLGES
jgi:hypothetical protein